MNAAEVLRFALRGIAAGKLRSALTTLGISIGVAAVILLVAVGNGAAIATQENVEQLGTNVLTVTESTRGPGGARPLPGGGPGGTATTEESDEGPRVQAKELSADDAEALGDATVAPSVRSASPVVTASSQAITHEGASHTVQTVSGSDPAYLEATNKTVARGSAFTADDVASARKVLVIGQTVADNLFGSADPVGQEVAVGGVPFTVAGVLAPIGGMGAQDADDVVIAPISAVQQSLTGYGGLSQIVVQATSPETVESAQQEITQILDQRHGVAGTPDYSIMNQAALMESLQSIVDMFTMLLGAVAAISLLVGGIGITNIMLVTVTERTREIGIRKAVGAQKGAILGQFMAEATVLSLFGGLIGALAASLGTLVNIGGITPVIVPSSVVMALGVSIAIGLFFGSWPANRAANLRPIDALRHE